MHGPLSAAFFLVALATAGCGPKGCRASTEAERAGAAGARAPGAGTNPAAAPAVRLSVTDDTLRIEVHGPREARLSPEATIERRREDGSFAPIGTYRLIAACDETPPDCLALTAGAELRPLPWRLVAGDDLQCDCDRCRRAPPGTYRFVVRSCDGARVESESFDLAL